MSTERTGGKRFLRFGCAGALLVLLLFGGLVLYGRFTAPSGAPEASREESAKASSKLHDLERSLRSGATGELQFSEEDLTLLARQYLEREGMEGSVQVSLPDGEVGVSFRTTLAQLRSLVDLSQLPLSPESDVWGTLRMRLSVVDHEPRAELESVSLYGIPLPLSVFGPTAHQNWLERLDDETLARIRRIRELEVRDRILFVSTG